MSTYSINPIAPLWCSGTTRLTADPNLNNLPVQPVPACSTEVSGDQPESHCMKSRVSNSCPVYRKIPAFSIEQKKNMEKVAQQVAIAIRDSKSREPLQAQIDRLVKSFVDFSEHSIRLSKEEVIKIERSIFLNFAFSQEIRTQYLNLSGYAFNDFEIVELIKVS